MSKTITPSAQWVPLDIDAICKLYDQTKTGTDVRQGNRVAAVHALISALNHLLAYSSRIIMQQGQGYGFRATTGSGALASVYEWRMHDYVVNERTWRYRIIATAPTAAAAAAYAQRDDDATVTTASTYQAIAAPTFPEDTWYDSMTYERGAAAGAIIEEGISTIENYSIVDLVVYTEPLPALEISVHDLIPGRPSPGHYVVANFLEAVRAKFFELRSRCLPVLFGWYAQGDTGTPSTTDATGIVVTSTDWVNILDQNFSARTATTPGFIFDCYKCAAGLEDRVPIWVSVKAAKVDGGSPAAASITIGGPDHVAPNYAERTDVTGAVAWYDMPNHIYGNSAVDVASVTTARNKADVLAKVGAVGDTLYIYAVRGEMAWTI